MVRDGRGVRRRLRWSCVLQSGCMTTGWREWIGNGCKVGPDYCKPPAPVADEWIPSAGAKVENRRLVDWWTVFDDPQLNELIETAYDQNLSLRVAGHARAAGAGAASDRGGRAVSAIATGIRAV